MILDVRSVMEYDAWHIPGAVNIPLDKLRNQPRTPAFMTGHLHTARSGFRSYLVYRLKARNKNAVRRHDFCNYHGIGHLPGTPEPPLLSYAEERQLALRAAPPAPGRVVELNCAGCNAPVRSAAWRKPCAACRRAMNW